MLVPKSKREEEPKFQKWILAFQIWLREIKKKKITLKLDLKVAFKKSLKLYILFLLKKLFYFSKI